MVNNINCCKKRKSRDIYRNEYVNNSIIIFHFHFYWRHLLFIICHSLSSHLLQTFESNWSKFNLKIFRFLFVFSSSPSIFFSVFFCFKFFKYRNVQMCHNKSRNIQNRFTDRSYFWLYKKFITFFHWWIKKMFSLISHNYKNKENASNGPNCDSKNYYFFFFSFYEPFVILIFPK